MDQILKVIELMPPELQILALIVGGIVCALTFLVWKIGAPFVSDSRKTTHRIESLVNDVEKLREVSSGVVDELSKVSFAVLEIKKDIEYLREDLDAGK